MKENAAELRAVPGRGARALSRGRGEDLCLAEGGGMEDSGSVEGEEVSLGSDMTDLLRVDIDVGRGGEEVKHVSLEGNGRSRDVSGDV